jgi:hypothetical protein
MRVYALLLGTLLTAASVAAVAIRSPCPARVARAPRVTAPVWYGGALPPITVEPHHTPTAATSE